MPIRVSRFVGASLDQQAGSIRAAGQAAFLPLPAAERANWLLAAQQACIFQSAYPSTISALDSRVYHLPSANCQRILIVAMIENSPGGAGILNVSPSDGAGTTVSAVCDYTGATTRWGSPGWFGAFLPATLLNTNFQYHKVEWSDLVVRHLAVFEIPRSYLNPASDTAVAMRDGAFAGLESRRMVTDGTQGGISDLLAAVSSANAETRRHVGGIMLPDASAWSVTSAGAWTNMADPFLLTSGFGFQHIARRVRSATSTVEYTARIRARYQGTGTGQIQILSAGGSISFTGLGAAWGWYAPDGAGTLSVDATADDTLIPEGQTTDGTTTVELAACQIMEAV
jgi:hypothetical protein